MFLQQREFLDDPEENEDVEIRDRPQALAQKDYPVPQPSFSPRTSAQTLPQAGPQLQRPVATSAALRAKMLGQQRRFFQSERDGAPQTAAEDPFGPLELPPPSHLFTGSSSIYEPAGVYSSSQHLDPVQLSRTVFSAEQRAQFEAASRATISGPFPGSRKAPDVRPATQIIRSPEALHSSPQPEPREEGFRPVNLGKFFDSPEETKQPVSQFSPSSREQPKPPDRPETPPGHFPSNRAAERPGTVPNLGISRSLATLDQFRPQTTANGRRAMTLQVILQQARVDMSAFLTNPLPKGFMMQCSVRRNRRGFHRIFPSYFLHTSEGQHFLLAAKKRSGNKSSNYLITMNETELKVKSPGYLGKLRSNFIGTEFTIYDTGTNPNKRNAAPETLREELGLVMYQANILGGKGPRKMRVILPELDAEGRRVQWKPASVCLSRKTKPCRRSSNKVSSKACLSYSTNRRFGMNVPDIQVSRPSC